MKPALWFLLSLSLAAALLNDLLEDPARTAVEIAAATVMLLSGLTLYLTRSTRNG
ncbi:hypothetical protein JNUCC64_23235 [Streptomyces sp. JNUCC 64]